MSDFKIVKILDPLSLQVSLDHSTLSNLTTGDPHTQYLLAAGDTISGAMTWAVDGVQQVISNDTTVFRQFIADNMASGSLNSLVGERIMYGWVHNATVSASGTAYSLGGRDVNGTHCQMVVFTESGKMIYYSTSNTTGSPSYVERFRIDLADGDTTHAGYINSNLGIICAGGTTAAGTAPIKFTDGTLMTTAEPGALEADNGRLYFTGTNTTDRMVLSQSEGSITSSTTVANTTTETTIHTHTISANELIAGRVFSGVALGQYSKGDADDVLTIRLKANGTTLATFTSAYGLATNVPLESIVTATCRTTGVSGTLMIFAKQVMDGMTAYYSPATTSTLNTTAAITITLTAQWDTAAAGSTVSVDQAYIDWRN